MFIAAKEQKGNSIGVCTKCTTRIHGVVCQKGPTTGICNKVLYFEEFFLFKFFSCAFSLYIAGLIGPNRAE